MLLQVTHYLCISPFPFDVRHCRFLQQIRRFIYTDLRVSLSVCFCLMKPTWCTICSQFILPINLCMFREYLYPIIRRYSVYIQHWYVLCFSVDFLLVVQQIFNWKVQQHNKKSRHESFINSHLDTVIFRYDSLDFGLGHFY